MINLWDIAYALGIGLSGPIWLLIPRMRRKVLAAFGRRMGQVPARDLRRPAVLIHAVSMGEINATRLLVQRLRQLRPELQIIISTTTETGFARGQELYPRPADESAAEAADVIVIRYPLDFTRAVLRVLDKVRPGVAVLMELEVWPNFVRQCVKRGVPVAVINGRMTEPSFRKYRLARFILRPTFGRLWRVCAQDRVNAERFAALGVRRDRLTITGTMKFDTATVGQRVEGDQQLAMEMGLRPNALIGGTSAAGGGGAGAERMWVCGSTGPGEERMVLDQYKELLKKHARLRLIIVPRHPERFDEVAELIEASGFEVTRRSAIKSQISNHEPQRPDVPAADSGGVVPPVILGDTMGELRKFYSLADVVFVGRTLVDLGPRQHGSDMIEPAALSKAVVVGPFTGNFADAMGRFREAGAMMEVSTGEELGQAVSVLLSTPEQAVAMGRSAQEVVMRERGATERHVGIVVEAMGENAE